MSTPKNQLNRTLGVIISFLVGVGMLACGFFILHSIEHDVDLVSICKRAPLFSADNLNLEADKFPLVALTGTIKIQNNLETETPLILKKYLAVASTTDVYAWEEHPTSQASGEGEPLKPLYLARWTMMPQQTKTFIQPEGHVNPEIYQAVKTWQQPNFFIGAYLATTVDVQLPKLKQLQLSDAEIKIPESMAITDTYLYSSAKAIKTPQIGDTRQIFSVLEVQGQQATLFCRVKGNKVIAADLQALVSFSTTQTLQRLFLCSPQDALKQLEDEYSTENILQKIIVGLLFFLGSLFLLSAIASFMQKTIVFFSFIDPSIIFFAVIQALLLCLFATFFPVVFINSRMCIAIPVALTWVIWLLRGLTQKKNPAKEVDGVEDF